MKNSFRKLDEQETKLCHVLYWKESGLFTNELNYIYVVLYRKVSWLMNCIVLYKKVEWPKVYCIAYELDLPTN